MRGRASVVPFVVLALALVRPARLASDLPLTPYFGNLHAHSSFSDGSGTPDQAFAQARVHLDFLALTEHNHDQAERGAKDRTDGLLIATNPSLYPQIIASADAHNADGQFVALWGQEFSTISKGNHANVLLAPAVITRANGDYKGLYGELGGDTVVQWNHPWDADNAAINYGRNQFNGSYTKLRKASARVRLIEVINGPGTKNDTGLRASVNGEAFYREYLVRQFRLAPTANQDNHYFTWGTLTDARTVVLATALTRAALLESVRALRVYASTDRNLKVTFAVNGVGMGGEVKTTSRDLTITYSIEDPDEGQARYKVFVVTGHPKLTDSIVEATLDEPTGNRVATVPFTTLHNRAFVYLKIVQHPGKSTKDTVITAPVWITVVQ